ncbi:MAG: leucyl/phenylalanyl-tRNA--protein transferase [Gammaproteobacteria bacterium]|jgi:leucyl/phenylalanyl-tRNA--protein transferase|nr:leucyl/phenylalanyl-tRNA--protein transferase [Gammaproteobacteria bacterium]
MSLPWLEPDAEPAFPPVETAMTDPDGLLAAGGKLSPAWLVTAYSQGIFPWFEVGQPVLWWSPDPRLVIYPERVKISRSMRKLIRKQPYLITMDSNFAAIIHSCKSERDNATGTWITDEMQAAYIRLHEFGLAHSIEVWAGSAIVGGLYGVALGKVFFGESMFSRQANASKIALIALALQLQRWQFGLIDCQVSSQHLLSMGAEAISRHNFCVQLRDLAAHDLQPGPWNFDDDFQLASDAI